MVRSSRTPSGVWFCIAVSLSIAIVSSGCDTASAPSRAAAAVGAASATAAASAPSALADPSATAEALSMDTAPRKAEPCPDPPKERIDPKPGPDVTIPQPSNLRRMEAFSTDFPQRLTVAAGSIWTANESIDSVTRIDAPTGNVTVIRVAPGLGPQRVVEAGNAVWASGAGGLVRIDTESNVVDPRIAGCTSSIESAFGSLWAGEMGGLLRVDPGTGLVVAEIRPGTAAAGSSCAVNAADDSVWLGCGHDLYRIDPTSNAVTATVTEAGTNTSVIAADGVAWVIAGLPVFGVVNREDAFATIERLDLETNRLVPATKRRLVHGAFAAGLLTDGHIVWLATSQGAGPDVGQLYAFEPASGKVIAAFDISEGKGYGSNGIAFAYGSLWTSSASANAVRRFPRPTP